MGEGSSHPGHAPGRGQGGALNSGFQNPRPQSRAPGAPLQPSRGCLGTCPGPGRPVPASLPAACCSPSSGQSDLAGPRAGPGLYLSVSSLRPINLGRGTCAPQHVINNLEHTFMDSAISAAFNPITLYGAYMRLLYCCNYSALYAAFPGPSFYFIFTFYSHSSRASSSKA